MVARYAVQGAPGAETNTNQHREKSIWNSFVVLLVPHRGQGGTHLYAGLVQLGDAGQLLPVVDVRVLVLPKGQLQLLQLLVAEGGAVASPGRGGVRPAPPAEADGCGGLTR